MKFEKKIDSLNELDQVARQLINSFSGQRIFAFYGKLGAGKTTLIQAICRVLGSEDYVTSPTFALVNEYKYAGMKPVYHFDFYRIKDLEEVFDIGYEEYFFSGNYCLIEWPEKVEPLLPPDRVDVKIDPDDSGVRYISAQRASQA